MFKTQNIKIILKGTLLSILVFFSISLISIILQLSPFHYFLDMENYQLTIGYPSTYYYQFWVNGNSFPNFRWFIKYLIADCFLTWVFVIVIYFKAKRKT